MKVKDSHFRVLRRLYVRSQDLLFSRKEFAIVVEVCELEEVEILRVTSVGLGKDAEDNSLISRRTGRRLKEQKKELRVHIRANFFFMRM